MLTRLFKQAISLSKQAKQIERILDEVTPFNTSKKKEEALVLFKKWFLKMENFNGQLKKYQVTITDLLEENRKLEERIHTSEDGKVKNRLEKAKLESELHDVQRILERIPPDILRELKKEKRLEQKHQR